MFKATKSICQAFDREGYKYVTDENEKTSRVTSVWSIKDGGDYRIHYISYDDDPDVSIRVFSLIHAADDQISSVLVALNKLNYTYRYLKFVLDADCDVNVEFDLPLRIADPGDLCVEMTRRFVNIIDEVYPILMEALEN